MTLHVWAISVRLQKAKHVEITVWIQGKVDWLAEDVERCPINIYSVIKPRSEVAGAKERVCRYDRMGTLVVACRVRGETKAAGEFWSPKRPEPLDIEKRVRV